MSTDTKQIFLCFAAEDRYTIAEPLVYHLKNYGISLWYDRYALLLGDNRQEKNINEGASQSHYALVILSGHTGNSPCAMEELAIIESRYCSGEVTVFPVLYELSPRDIPSKLSWIKSLIFKEANRHSGTREICNHVGCKITSDILNGYAYRNISDIISAQNTPLSNLVTSLLTIYQNIDCGNLNSRITLLYAIYVIALRKTLPGTCSHVNMTTKIFERLFTETRLNLTIDYRELWLLENSLCILINCLICQSTESKI